MLKVAVHVALLQVSLHVIRNTYMYIFQRWSSRKYVSLSFDLNWLAKNDLSQILDLSIFGTLVCHISDDCRMWNHTTHCIGKETVHSAGPIVLIPFRCPRWSGVALSSAVICLLWTVFTSFLPWMYFLHILFQFFTKWYNTYRNYLGILY